MPAMPCHAAIPHAEFPVRALCDGRRCGPVGGAKGKRPEGGGHGQTDSFARGEEWRGLAWLELGNIRHVNNHGARDKGQGAGGDEEGETGSGRGGGEMGTGGQRTKEQVHKTTGRRRRKMWMWQLILRFQEHTRVLCDTTVEFACLSGIGRG